MVETLNFAFLVLFTGGLLATTLALVARLIAYKREGLRPPTLAKRDMALAVTLSWPFLLILLVRATGLTGEVSGTLWWTILTGLPPTIGVMQFAYFEYFVIERGDSRGYLAYLSQAVKEKEDRDGESYS